MEKIGNVVLDDTFYTGVDRYTEGEIEDMILEAFREGKSIQALKDSTQWPILYHMSDLRENLLEWYPFESGAELLEIGAGCGALTGLFSRRVKKVTCIELSKKRSMINAERNRNQDNIVIKIGNFEDIRIEQKFDYITLIGVWEYAGLYVSGEEPHKEMLRKLQRYLKPQGKLIIAIENKMGLKYWNGAKEDHLGKAFVGIEDYRNTLGIRTFSKPEICAVLEGTGISRYEFYYPMPDYKLPDTIFSDKYMPAVGDVRTWGKNYDSVRIALYNEGIAWDQVCRDGMCSYFANSFLVVCGGQDSPVRYAHYTGTRNKEYQTKTVIEDGGRVKKSYLWKGSRKYDIFAKMQGNYRILQKEFPRLVYLEPAVRENVLEYPYIKGSSLETELMGKLHDPDRIIARFRELFGHYLEIDRKYTGVFEVTDEYREYFGDSFVETKEMALQVTNIDMALQNLIVADGKVFCIDYEWVFDFPVPFEFVLYRCAEVFYLKYGMYFMHQYNFESFVEMVGVKKENIAVYRQMNAFFYRKTSGEGNIERFRKESGMLEIKI